MRRSPRRPTAVAPRPVRTPVILDGRPAEWRALDRLGWFAAPSWQPWRTALRALLADPLTPADGPEVLQLYTQCTGRAAWPTTRHREGFFIVGRRGGKTAAMAKLVVALACFTDCTAFLEPGETATVMCLASDRRQARTLYRYILGRLQSDPALAALILDEPTQTLIRLRNRVEIEVHTASYRAVRSFTALAVIADEAAFWSREHRSNPDTEVLTALRPTLDTIPHSLLLTISTPYARRGALFDEFQAHWGAAPDRRRPVVVWKADTLTMNPSFNPATVEAATAKDPAAARAEYGAEFRSDLESYVLQEVVGACVDGGVQRRAPAGWGHCGYVDPAGGGSDKADAMTLGIAHLEPGPDGQPRGVLDCVVEVRPRFNPDEVVGGFAELCQAYGVAAVEGDQYAGVWPASRFAAHGIAYTLAPRTKNQLYRDFLPLLTAQRVRLLDDAVLTTQLLNLERRTGRDGKDHIDTPPGTRDDVINAAAGALLLALDGAAQQDLRALEQWDAEDWRVQRVFANHMGIEGVTTHPDYIPPGHLALGELD